MFAVSLNHRAIKKCLIGLLSVGLSFVVPTAEAQIDLTFANFVQGTDGNDANLGPSYSGTILDFTDVAPGSGLDIDLRVTVTNVTANYYYELSIPDYKATTIPEPNGDLGYRYYHDDGLPFGIGGMAYNLQFYEGGGTFTTTTTLPAFRFLIYDVDGETVQSESVRVFSADGFAGYGVSASGVTVENSGAAYLFTGLGSNVAEDDPSGALVLIYENTGKLTFQMESNTTADDGFAGDNPVFSAIDGDLSLIGGDTSDFEPFIRVSGSISGSVTTDANNDGLGDFPIAGVTLTLKDSSGSDIDIDPLTTGTQPFTTTTDASGNYTFNNVPTGSFRVVQTQPVEFASVSDTDGANNNVIGDENPIIVVADTDTPGNNFVEQAPQSITGTVVLDGDGNGTGEAPLAGILVQLLDDLGNPVDGDPGTSGVQAITATTDANGDYYLPAPTAGNYIVKIDTADLPTPMPVSFDPEGALDGEGTVTVAAAENVIDVDFGYTGAVLTGNVFSDRDNDGSKGTEPGLSNVDLLITDSAAGTQTVTTDASGNYSVVVPLGSTNVDVVNGTVPSGYSLTTANDPQDVVVATGGSVAADIGYYNPQAVSGHLFHDIDGDGVQGANEPDLSGVTVFVEDSATDIEVVVTDANGNYLVNVPTGSTILDVNDSTLPVGSALTTANDPQTVTVNSGATTVSPSVGYTLPLLSVLKSADTAGPVGIGASVDYTVDVFNNSTVSHTGIDVSDVLTNGTIDYGSGVNVSAPATGTLTTSITEDWNSDDYTGGTPTSGAPAWSGNWIEIGEVDGATAGNIQVLLDGVGKRLQILGNATSSIGAQRVVDLSGMTSATVAFEYRRKNLDAAADYVTVEMSNDGTGWAEIGRISGVDAATTTDTTYQVQAPITIPVTYLTDTARIRFVSSATMDGGDTIYIDDINIAANLVIAQTGSPGTTAPDLATDYIIDPGQSMSITYTATVDYSDGFDTITNIASATSDQQGTPESSSAGVAVANGSISGVVESDIDDDNNGDFGIGGVQLLLLDSAGNPVDDPSQPGVQDYIVTSAFGTGAYSFADVPAGSYRVSEVQPTGYVSVSDVDGANNNIIGDETPIAVTANVDSGGNDFLEEPAASIGDRLWVDEDADGLQDAGEPGIAGVRVFLDSNSNGALDDGEVWTVTDADGGYLFTDLAEGTYNVTVDTGVVSGTPPSALTGAALASSLVANPTYNEDTGTTSPNHTSAVTVAVGEAHQTADFGYNYASVAETDTASSGALGAIGDRIWNDADADGVQDLGEAGIGGVTVSLLADPDKDGIYTATGTTTTTDASGNYFFDGLAVGSYKISVTPPAGYSATADLDGVGAGAGGTDSVTTSAIIVAPGDTFLNADFGYALDAGGSVIGDTVYLDIDGDGVKDVTDPGIAGVSVVLLDSSGSVIATDTTDSTGNYSFPGLPDGTYTVWVNDVAQVLNQWSQTGDPDATLDGRSTVVVDSGTATVYNDEDFGFAPAGHSVGDGYIGDTVFLDSGDGAGGAANGSADPGEGMAGVVVNLYASDGTTLLATTITNVDGTYGFGDLDAGATYVVAVDAASLPGGLTNTIDPNGSDPVNEASVNLAALGGSTLAQDFGYTTTGSANSIGGTLWTDVDASGVLDGSETVRFAGVSLQLLDLSGAVVATTTTDSSGNYSFSGLPDGSYTVVVTDDADLLNGYWHSTGTTGNDSHSQNDAGYSVNVSGGSTDTTADFGYYRSSAAIGDFVWIDADGNGIQGAETGVPDGTKVTLSITYPNSDVITVVTTTVNGAYGFNNLLLDEDFRSVTDGSSGPDPIYSLSFEVPSGHVATSTGQGTSATDSNGTSFQVTGLSQGQTDIDYDSGFVPVASLASLGSLVWNDINGDGIYDSGTESGLANVTVNVYDSGSNLVGTDVTDGAGAWAVTGLLPGDYTVEFVPPSGYALSPQDAGSPNDDTVDSDADPATYTTATVNLSAGENDLTIDAGMFEGATIGNRLWVDENADGVQDGGEPGIPGVTVELYDSSGTTLIATTTTDVDGGYVFTDVPAGVYTVKVDTTSFPSSLSDNPTYDEDGGIATPNDETAVTVAAGDEHVTADFGYNYASSTETNDPANATTPLGAIGDRIWNDANGDGVQDPGEIGIAGVTVKLLTDSDDDGVYTDSGVSVVTDAHGNYVLDGLAPGAYVVEVDITTLPVAFGSTPTGDPDGDFNNTSAPIVIAPGDVFLNADFGYDTAAGGSVIGDTLYLDADGDGVKDAGDPGIAGVTVALLDSSGNVIGTTITDSSGNYSFPGLPDGTYAVWVNDTGNVLGELDQTGDPDATLDRTSMVIVNSGTSTTYNDEDFGFAPSGHGSGDGLIGDTLFLDSGDGAGGAANGTPDPGEGLEGVTVELYDAGGSTLLATTVTNENGNYSFGGLDPAATYTVKVDASTLPTGLNNTIDPDASTGNESVVDLSATSGINLAQDFGYTAPTPNTIGGTLFTDSDASGILDGGESGDLSGVTVELRDASGNVVASTTTDGSGNYSFPGLPDGTYTVVVTDDANLLDGMWHSEGTPSTDNNSQNSAGVAVTVAGGVNDTTSDFGYYDATATLGDLVWVDSDGNGIQGAEGGVPDGTEVTLTITYPSGEMVTVVTTTSGGAYSFANLLADEDYRTATSGSSTDPTYVLAFETPAGHVATYTGQGTTTTDSDGTSATVTSLTQGETNTSYDSGFVPPASQATLGNLIWNDLDGNGLYDSGSEAGIPDVTVQLFRSGDDPDSALPVATTTSLAGGVYSFSGLLPGDYFVFVPAAELNGGDLDGMTSSPGSPDADLDTTDSDDNGYLDIAGVRTFDVTLSAGEVNNTVDLGFSADSDGDQIPDGTEGGGDRDADQIINQNDFDPQGYFYLPGSGLIVPGGAVTVAGPGTVNIIKDGSVGSYQYTVANTASAEETYTLTITPPPGYEVDTAFQSGSAYNPTSAPVPNSLGAGEDANSGVLTNGSGTTFYTQLTLHPDDPLVINNNIPLKKKALATYDAWESEFATAVSGNTGATANGDADLYDNLIEYALCLDPGSGVESHAPFCVEQNVGGGLDAVFVRREGHTDLSFTLEARDAYAGLGSDSLAWFDASSMDVASGAVTVQSNGDGTETVRFTNLETIAGLGGGEGYVRLRIDGSGGSIDGETSYSQIFGWLDTSVGQQCETSSDPFMKKEDFSGAIVSANTGAGTIDVSTSVGAQTLASVIDGAKNYYIEIVAGDHAGHRFEIDESATLSGDGSTLYINEDVSESDSEGNYNTDALADLANLAGDTIVLREHRVMNDLFPVADFTATNTHVTADRFLFFNSASSFNIYWAYDGSAHDAVTRWVSRTTYEDQGSVRVIRPCEGFYVHPQGGAVTLRYVGIVRQNAMACPLNAGWNFVGNGWPVDRHPAPDQPGVMPDTVQIVNDLGMTEANGFTGDLSRPGSDQIQLWKADAPENFGAEGYTGYHLLSGDLSSIGLGVRSHWNSMGSTELKDANGVEMLKSGRGMFLKMQNANDTWIIPAP